MRRDERDETGWERMRKGSKGIRKDARRMGFGAVETDATDDTEKE